MCFISVFEIFLKTTIYVNGVPKQYVETAYKFCKGLILLALFCMNCLWNSQTVPDFANTVADFANSPIIGAILSSTVF